MEKPAEHDVRKNIYGCSGIWVWYTCVTCNVTVKNDGESLLDSKKWEAALKEFLSNHPCSNIKDETRHRTSAIDED